MDNYLYKFLKEKDEEKSKIYFESDIDKLIVKLALFCENPSRAKKMLAIRYKKEKMGWIVNRLFRFYTKSYIDNEKKKFERFFDFLEKR